MKVRNGTERVRVRDKHAQKGEHFWSSSRTMRCVRARSESGLSSGDAESVRSDDVSWVSKAAARAKCEAATMPGICVEGIKTCVSAAGSSLSMPSAV